MVNVDESTENQILEAAREVFLEKGYDGTRMQEIANRAGINKALLHYYFRSKEKLFMGIFVEAISKLVPQMHEAIQSQVNFKQLISVFVTFYHEIMYENQNLPLFVMREIHRMPEILVKMMKEKGFDFNLLKFLINKEVQLGHIRQIDPIQFMVSLLGMCFFPFIGMPIIKGVMMDNDSEKLNEFFENRKDFIIEFTLKALDYVEEN